jgi:signal transduction histidine kinase
LVKLLNEAGTQREAFARGVRDERHRIARDMHDDLGAGLLSTLHQQDLDTTRDAIRQAIGDVRSIVNELSDKPVSVSELLAELRVETMRRLEAAGIAAEWPVTTRRDDSLAAHGVYRHCTAMVRELTSNVIRHSGAKRVRCIVTLDEQRLTFTITDDGRGFEAGKEGNGLKNLRRRASALGGSFVISRQANETAARIEVSLKGEAPQEAPPPPRGP